MKAVKIFSDGASRGNPGDAAIGVQMLDDNNQCFKEVSVAIGKATNNVAEYTALVYGLQSAIALRAESVQFFCDSELVVKQILGEYKVKDDKLKPLFTLAKHLISKIKIFKIKHVSREENKEADRLANEALNGSVERSVKTAFSKHSV